MDDSLHVSYLRRHGNETRKHCHKVCQKGFNRKMFNINNNLLGWHYQLI